MSDFEEAPLTPEQKAANRERNIQRIAEQWAEHEALTVELEELQRLPSPNPAQLRRIAELVEDLRGLEASRPHWEAAASAGDRDAQDRLDDWDAKVSDVAGGLSALRQMLLNPAGDLTEEEMEEIRTRVVNDMTQYKRDVEAIRSMDPKDFE